MNGFQSAASAIPAQAPYIVQRNLGMMRGDRVLRPTFPGALGKRYEVLEKRSEGWSLITVLTVVDGGRRD